MDVSTHLPLRAVLSSIALGVCWLGSWRFSGSLNVVGLLFLLVLLAIPLGFYLLVLRTRIASLLTGIILIGVVVYVQHMVSTAWEHSSTAPLLYLWLPLAGSVAVAIGVFADLLRE
jgi:lipopolysaccharide export LptBFGC system permease protein LptF